jgi:hypothetical protein
MAAPQRLAPTNPIRQFLSEEQDPKQVQRVLEKVRQILTSKEEILYVAVQKTLTSLSPDSVVLTTRRFIVYRPTLLGGANFRDYAWRDLRDARLSDGTFSSTITLQTIKNELLSVNHLPKAQARKVYSFAQEMEERVREERRQRDMEEKRAAAGGIVLQGTVPATPPAHDDPLQKLRKLKDMMSAGLITAAEYEAKKAEILSKM